MGRNLHRDRVDALVCHRREQPLQSGASGVVRERFGRPSIRMPVVPMIPGVRPSARNTASSKYVVVVFPFVPVTPTTVIPSAGRP
jgi:hypothetical protein